MPSPVAGGHEHSLPAALAPAPEWGVRIRDFLTDGSVAALCDELGKLTGVPVWLRDQSGEAIIPVWSEESPHGAPGVPQSTGGHPWSIVPEPAARARAFDILKLSDDGSFDAYAMPMRISTGVLGAIVACLPKRAFLSSVGSPDAPKFQSIRRALLLMASILCDVCESQVALRRRVLELDALYRLSSLLTAARDADELLEIALDLAMQVLRADAGSIALIADHEADEPDTEPIIAASRNLSIDWISRTGPLSYQGELRRAALAGAIVRVEDLTRDPRIDQHQRAHDEGLRAMLSTGLIDQAAGTGHANPGGGGQGTGRPIGLIRLYNRHARVYTEAEGELLRAIAEHSASAVVNARLRSLRQQDEQVKRQVRLAASVQRRMLPRSVPRMPPFDVAAHYAPSYDLGGDFYDFIELGGHLGILVGDVVGKGVPAALLMSAVRAAVRAHSEHLYHIDELFSRVNRSLALDTLDNEFATVWYGVADPHSLRLTYCGAGHDWPLLVRVPQTRPVEDKDVQRLTADGMALGIDPTQKYPKGTFQLAPRDVMVVFTDGLHDATNFEGKRFGGTRLRKALLELLASEPEASAARIVDHIIAQVRQHAGVSGRSDDITVVVMRVGTPP